MSPKTKKRWVITVVIVIVLMFLNPSFSEFKAFKGYESYGYRERRPKPPKPLIYEGYSRQTYKVCNLLVCSVYSSHGDLYLGIIKNFIPLN